MPWSRPRGGDDSGVTVAFVFSGGASLGASQAGMLEALYLRGIRPDLLVGTSAGAINAVFVASRPQGANTARDLQRVWRALSRSEIFPANPVSAGLGLFGRRNHSVSAASLTRLLQQHVHIERLEDAAVPVHVVAAEVLSGEEVLISRGPAVDAVLASAAIPGVFPPVSLEDRMLIDGGIVNNTPISHAVDLGADTIVVLPAVSTTQLRSVPHGALALGITGVLRAIGRRFAEDLVRYSDVAELIVLPSPNAALTMPTDFSHADELIEEAFRRARALLAARRPSRALLRAA
jgi:NTE family protein